MLVSQVEDEELFQSLGRKVLKKLDCNVPIYLLQLLNCLLYLQQHPSKFCSFITSGHDDEEEEEEGNV